MRYLILLCSLMLLSTGVMKAQSSLKSIEKLVQKREYNKAIESLNGLKTIRTDKDALALRGKCYYQTNELRKSAIDLTKSFELGNEDLELKYYMARINHSKRKYKDAIYFYKEYLRNSKKDDQKDPKIALYIKQCFSGMKYDYTSNTIGLVQNAGKGINTSRNEINPVPSPSAANKFYFACNESGNYDVFGAEMDKGIWNRNDKLPKSLNTKEDDVIQDISMDGSIMMFMRGKFSKKNNQLLLNRYAKSKSSQRILNSTIKPHSGDRDAYLVNDEVLIFASNREGGFGGYDLYYTKYSSRGWSKPINMGPNINSAFDERYPFMTEDKKTIYFSSNRAESIGGYDIFIVKKDGPDWGDAMNPNQPLNSAEDDINFRIQEDGSQGFFSSNRKTGHGGYDIYAIFLKRKQTIHKSEEGQPLALIQSSLKDGEEEIIKDAAPKTESVKETIPKDIVEDIDVERKEEVMEEEVMVTKEVKEDIVEEKQPPVEETKEEEMVEEKKEVIEEVFEKEIVEEVKEPEMEEIEETIEDVKEEIVVEEIEEPKEEVKEVITEDVKSNIQETEIAENLTAVEEKVNEVENEIPEAIEEELAVEEFEEMENMNEVEEVEEVEEVIEEKPKRFANYHKAKNRSSSEKSTSEKSSVKKSTEVSQKADVVVAEETKSKKDKKAKPEKATKKKESKVTLIPNEDALVISPLYYKDDNDVLSPDNQKTLDQVILAMNKFPHSKLILTCHSLPEGLPEFELMFTIRRVQNISDYLENNGIDETRIYTNSVGSAYPAVRKISDKELYNQHKNTNNRIDMVLTNTDESIVFERPEVKKELKDKAYELYQTIIDDDVYFRVLIHESEKDMYKNAILRYYNDLYIEKDNIKNTYRYYVGLYPDFVRSFELKRKIENKYEKESEIVAFYNGMQINKDEAKLLKTDYPELQNFLDLLDDKYVPSETGSTQE